MLTAAAPLVEALRDDLGAASKPRGPVSTTGTPRAPTSAFLRARLLRAQLEDHVDWRGATVETSSGEVRLCAVHSDALDEVFLGQLRPRAKKFDLDDVEVGGVPGRLHARRRSAAQHDPSGAATVRSRLLLQATYVAVVSCVMNRYAIERR